MRTESPKPIDCKGAGQGWLHRLSDRRTKNLCSFRQANLLCKYGLPPNVSFDVAKRWIDRIAGNKWRVPTDIRDEVNECGAGKS